MSPIEWLKVVFGPDLIDSNLNEAQRFYRFFLIYIFVIFLIIFGVWWAGS